MSTLLTLALFATAAPAAASAVGPAVTVEALADGTTLIHARRKGDAPVSIQYVVRSGSADDPPNRAGLAHLLEHLVFQGTYEEPEGLMWEKVADAGGSMNAFTFPEFTTYVLDVPQSELRATVPSFLAMITSPALPFADLEREKGVVDAEHMDRPNAQSIGWAIDQLVFPAANQGLTGIGTRESRAAITLEELQAFYAEHYTAGNSAIVVVGDVELAEVKALVDQGLRSAPGVRGPALDVPEPANVPSEAKALSWITVTAHGRLVDGFSIGACEAAAEVLELRLRKKVFADERMPAWIDGFCHRQRGHDFMVLSVMTSSPESSLLPEWMKQIVRAAVRTPPTAREKALVEARRGATSRLTAARPSSYAWELTFAVSRDDLPIPEAVRAVTKPPRLEWGRVPALFAAAASDKTLVELHFSRFED